MAKQPPKGRGSRSKAAKASETETETPVVDASPEGQSSDLAEAAEGESLVVTDPQLAEDGEPEVAEDDVRQDAEEAPDPEVEAAEALVMTDPQLVKDGEPEVVEGAGIVAEDPAPAADPEPVETAEPVTRPAPAPVQQTSGGSTFIPMVLGGLLAGGIGYGVAYLQYVDQDVAESVDPARVAALEERIDALPEPAAATDLSGVEGGIAGARDEIAALRETLTSLDERLGLVERQPSADGTLQESAIAAFERDMDELRTQIADQQANMQAMADQASQQIEATRAEALEIEQNALDAARSATARAALAKVQGALDSGAPLGAALAELEDTLDRTAPGALLAVSDGVATLADLRADFPAAARQALSIARAEGVSGEEGSAFGAFLRDQFDVRSVEPQEGETTDAILSRAESALDAGRLNDALAEVATLPEVARAEISDWTARAEARAAAVDAAETLAIELNAN